MRQFFQQLVFSDIPVLLAIAVSFLLSTLLAYLSAKTFYFQLFWKTPPIMSYDSGPPPRVSIWISLRGRVRTIRNAIFSYLLTILGFSFVYQLVSKNDPVSFNVGQLDLTSASYFSLGTMATAAYGDIYPISTTARILTMIQTIIGLAFVIFFFSMFTSLISPWQEESH